MVFYFGLSLRHVRWRAVMLVFSALIVLAVIGSSSRAGFLVMGAVILCMALSSRYRIRGLVAVMCVGFASLVTAGDEIRDRFASILTYRYDLSASTRFEVWNFAWELLNENPLIGVGFNQFETARWAMLGGTRAAHNIYLQNLAELGLIGHPLWLLLIFGSMFSVFRFMRWSRRLPPDYRWAYQWSRGLLLALVAFCIHGGFHNEEYFELTFAIIGLNVALQIATRRELAARNLKYVVEQEAHRRAARGRRRIGSRRRGAKKRIPSLSHALGMYPAGT